MKKMMVCYSNYSGEKSQFFNTYTEKNFNQYCEKNNIDFYLIKDQKNHTINRHPTWMSWEIISNLIDDCKLVDGDKVFSLDADTCITKMNENMTSDMSFGYAIDSCNTHCMGFYTLTINEWSRKFVKNVLNEQRYQDFKDTSIWSMWNDQASVYSLFGIQRHSWTPFSLLLNNGWHSCVTEDTLYNIEDINKNVQIFPTEWNVTHVAGENLNEFFINPTHKKDTVIRHFAGGQKWNEAYFKV